MGFTYPAGRKRGANLLLPTAILRPRNEIGLKPFGLASVLTDSSVAQTYQMKFVIEADFDAVQLVYYSHQTNQVTNLIALVAATETASTSSTNNISQPIVGGTAYTNKDDTNDAYGWRSVTWGGAASPTAPAGSATAPSITKSDWIPCASVPRADGGVGRLLLVRGYVNGATNLHTVLNSGQIRAEMQTPSAENRGRIIQGAVVAGDAVTTQTSSPTALSTNAMCIGVNVRLRGVGLTVMCVGDSTTQCASLVNDRLTNWGFRACADVSTEAFPVQAINQGQASVNSAAYFARALDAAAAWSPGCIVYQVSSPNDLSTSAGVYRKANQDKLAQLQQLVSYGQTNGIAVIANTAFPKNHNATIDAERVALNTQLRRMASRGHILLADMDRVLSDGATPGRIRTAFNFGDDIHPNEAGVEAMSQELVNILRQLISTR